MSNHQSFYKLYPKARIPKKKEKSCAINNNDQVVLRTRTVRNNLSQERDLCKGDLIPRVIVLSRIIHPRKLISWRNAWRILITYIFGSSMIGHQRERQLVALLPLSPLNPLVAEFPPVWRVDYRWLQLLLLLSVVSYTRIIIIDLIWTLHQRIITIQWAIDEDLSWEDRNEIHFHSRSSLLLRAASPRDRERRERNENRGEKHEETEEREAKRERINSKISAAEKKKGGRRRREKCRISCVTQFHS